MTQAIVCVALLVQGVAAEPPGGGIFVENQDGQIVIEAENSHGRVGQGAHTWVTVQEPAGFSGSGAVEAQPNDGDKNDEDFVTLSPRMDYKVKFSKAGAYRVWVRAWGRHDGDNSCHVGLDGKPLERSDRMGEWPTQEWAWCNDTWDSEPAEVEGTAGEHTLNVWMREDGILIDKILLTQDAGYIPKDAGPAESRE